MSVLSRTIAVVPRALIAPVLFYSLRMLSHYSRDIRSAEIAHSFRYHYVDRTWFFAYVSRVSRVTQISYLSLTTIDFKQRATVAALGKRHYLDHYSNFSTYTILARWHGLH